MVIAVGSTAVELTLSDMVRINRPVFMSRVKLARTGGVESGM